MSQVAVDFVLAISYDVERPENTVLRTNMNSVGVQEVLEAWIHEEIQRPKDTRPAVKKPVYTIKLGLELSEDIIHMNSDTGNRSLTLGIVADVFARLSEFTLQPLA